MFRDAERKSVVLCFEVLCPAVPFDRENPARENEVMASVVFKIRIPGAGVRMIESPADCFGNGSRLVFGDLDGVQSPL